MSDKRCGSSSFALVVDYSSTQCLESTVERSQWFQQVIQVNVFENKVNEMNLPLLCFSRCLSLDFIEFFTCFRSLSPSQIQIWSVESILLMPQSIFSTFRLLGTFSYFIGCDKLSFNFCCSVKQFLEFFY